MKKILFYSLILFAIFSCEDHIEYIEVVSIEEIEGACECECNKFPDNGLVAWYPFNNTLYDESGNGNDLMNSEIEFVQDRYETQESSVYFDGMGINLFTENDITQYLPPTSQTISFWFQNKSSNYRSIFALGNEDSARLVITPNTYDNLISIQGGENGCLSCTGNGGYINTEAEDLNEGWHHMVYTIDAQNINIWYDGGLLLSSPHQGFNCSNEDFKLYLGNDIVCGSEYYEMYMDDVGLWDRVLTEQEIQYLYNN